MPSNDPANVIGVSDQWILQPEDPWEVTGYVPNVVFTCGAVAENDGTVKIYWGGADTVMCAGTAVHRRNWWNSASPIPDRHCSIWVCWVG